MRVLNFPDVKTYEIMYEGLVSQGTKGAETRTLSKVLTKFEDVGVKKTDPQSGKESLLYTQADSTPIELEDAEYELVKKLLNEVEWSGIGARTAGQMLDWLESIVASRPQKVE